MVRGATAGQREVRIDAAGVSLDGTLTLPSGAQGLVIFAHGSGSGRFSSRNRFVADFLYNAGFATLLFDLLTGDENSRDQSTAEYRFDIPRLSERLAGAVDWSAAWDAAAGAPIGLFGASTGASAALVAAAARRERIAAIVSRGGRPDLAGKALPLVQAPTLLIVGGDDTQVIGLNQQAARRLRCEHETRIVPGASHLFEEPGKLEEVANLAAGWFGRYLAPGREQPPDRGLTPTHG